MSISKLLKSLLLGALLTISINAEEVDNSMVCDNEYNKCSKKCGDSSESCSAACDSAYDKCIESVPEKKEEEK